MAKTPKWYSIPTTMRMTAQEYRANINGLNVVFGAVLGFVLAGADQLGPFEFSLVLILSAATVTMIFYLASSPYRLFYAVTTAALIAGLPYLLSDIDFGAIPLLQPTLGVWAAMVLGIELMPRERDEKDTAG